jgi:hypothetical protein
MCSYQRINGSYGCQNSKALNGLLKNELGFRAMLCPTVSLRMLACHPPTPVWYVLSPGLRAPPI